MCSKSYKSWFGTVSVSTIDNTSEVSWIIELTGDRRKIKLRDVKDVCNSHNFVVVLAGFKLFMFNIYSPMVTFYCCKVSWIMFSCRSLVLSTRLVYRLSIMITMIVTKYVKKKLTMEMDTE